MISLRDHDDLFKTENAKICKKKKKNKGEN